MLRTMVFDRLPLFTNDDEYESLSEKHEGWGQDVLSEAGCQGGVYDEAIIRSKVDKIQVFDSYI